MCVTLCSLKHDNEQLVELVIVQSAEVLPGTYYGSAQDGHLYFFSSVLHTPQSASDMLGRSSLDFGLFNLAVSLASIFRYVVEE